VYAALAGIISPRETRPHRFAVSDAFRKAKVDPDMLASTEWKHEKCCKNAFRMSWEEAEAAAKVTGALSLPVDVDAESPLGSLD
jgi:hypothetical protein